MKTIKLFIILITLIGFISCEKDDAEVANNISVDKYIELLKLNQYDSLDLPEFGYNDIPELLKYRNETQIINNFPHNLISSLYAPECKLGMYVLWTIESIRAVAIDSEYLIMRFPSQNPILALRNSEELSLVYDNISHETAAESYLNWWENNKHKDFDEFKSINPLSDTNYKWH